MEQIARLLKFVKIFFWIMSVLGAIYGGWIVFSGVDYTSGLSMSVADSAYMAAVAGVGLAYAVIPYCLARAVDHLIKKEK